MSSREETNTFWSTRWEDGKTGWHKDHTNPHLVEYIDYFGKDVKDARVLVPLCGKTVDMMFLHEKGFHVVGIEVVELAVKQFLKKTI